MRKVIHGLMALLTLGAAAVFAPQAMATPCDAACWQHCGHMFPNAQTDPEEREGLAACMQACRGTLCGGPNPT
jgi:hypothetical protein